MKCVAHLVACLTYLLQHGLGTCLCARNPVRDGPARTQPANRGTDAAAPARPLHTAPSKPSQSPASAEPSPTVGLPQCRTIAALPSPSAAPCCNEPQAFAGSEQDASIVTNRSAQPRTAGLAGGLPDGPFMVHASNAAGAPGPDGSMAGTLHPGPLRAHPHQPDDPDERDDLPFAFTSQLASMVDAAAVAVAAVAIVSPLPSRSGSNHRSRVAVPLVRNGIEHRPAHPVASRGPQASLSALVALAAAPPADFPVQALLQDDSSTVSISSSSDHDDDLPSPSGVATATEAAYGADGSPSVAAAATAAGGGGGDGGGAGDGGSRSRSRARLPQPLAPGLSGHGGQSHRNAEEAAFIRGTLSALKQATLAGFDETGEAEILPGLPRLRSNHNSARTFGIGGGGHGSAVSPPAVVGDGGGGGAYVNHVNSVTQAHPTRLALNPVVHEANLAALFGGGAGGGATAAYAASGGGDLPPLAAAALTTGGGGGFSGGAAAWVAVPLASALGSRGSGPAIRAPSAQHALTHSGSVVSSMGSPSLLPVLSMPAAPDSSGAVPAGALSATRLALLHSPVRANAAVQSATLSDREVGAAGAVAGPPSGAVPCTGSGEALGSVSAVGGAGGGGAVLFEGFGASAGGTGISGQRPSVGSGQPCRPNSWQRAAAAAGGLALGGGGGGGLAAPAVPHYADVLQQIFARATAAQQQLRRQLLQAQQHHQQQQHQQGRGGPRGHQLEVAEQATAPRSSPSESRHEPPSQQPSWLGEAGPHSAQPQPQQPPAADRPPMKRLRAEAQSEQPEAGRGAAAAAAGPAAALGTQPPELSLASRPRATGPGPPGDVADLVDEQRQTKRRSLDCDRALAPTEACASAAQHQLPLPLCERQSITEAEPSFGLSTLVGAQARPVIGPPSSVQSQRGAGAGGGGGGAASVDGGGASGGSGSDDSDCLFFLPMAPSACDDGVGGQANGRRGGDGEGRDASGGAAVMASAQTPVQGSMDRSSPGGVTHRDGTHHPSTSPAGALAVAPLALNAGRNDPAPDPLLTVTYALPRLDHRRGGNSGEQPRDMSLTLLFTNASTTELGLPTAAAGGAQEAAATAAAVAPSDGALPAAATAAEAEVTAFAQQLADDQRQVLAQLVRDKWSPFSFPLLAPPRAPSSGGLQPMNFPPVGLGTGGPGAAVAVRPQLLFHGAMSGGPESSVDSGGRPLTEAVGLAPVGPVPAASASPASAPPGGWPPQALYGDAAAAAAAAAAACASPPPPAPHRPGVAVSSNDGDSGSGGHAGGGGNSGSGGGRGVSSSSAASGGGRGGSSSSFSGGGRGGIGSSSGGRGGSGSSSGGRWASQRELSVVAVGSAAGGVGSWRWSPPSAGLTSASDASCPGTVDCVFLQLQQRQPPPDRGPTWSIKGATDCEGALQSSPVQPHTHTSAQAQTQATAASPPATAVPVVGDPTGAPSHVGWDKSAAPPTPSYHERPAVQFPDPAAAAVRLDPVAAAFLNPDPDPVAAGRVPELSGADLALVRGLVDRKWSPFSDLALGFGFPPLPPSPPPAQQQQQQAAASSLVPPLQHPSQQHTGLMQPQHHHHHQPPQQRWSRQADQQDDDDLCPLHPHSGPIGPAPLHGISGAPHAPPPAATYGPPPPAATATAEAVSWQSPQGFAHGGLQALLPPVRGLGGLGGLVGQSPIPMIPEEATPTASSSDGLSRAGRGGGEPTPMGSSSDGLSGTGRGSSDDVGLAADGPLPPGSGSVSN